MRDLAGSSNLCRNRREQQKSMAIVCMCVCVCSSVQGAENLRQSIFAYKRDSYVYGILYLRLCSNAQIRRRMSDEEGTKCKAKLRTTFFFVLSLAASLPVRTQFIEQFTAIECNLICPSPNPNRIKTISLAIAPNGLTRRWNAFTTNTKKNKTKLFHEQDAINFIKIYSVAYRLMDLVWHHITRPFDLNLDN